MKRKFNVSLDPDLYEEISKVANQMMVTNRFLIELSLKKMLPIFKESMKHADKMVNIILNKKPKRRKKNDNKKRD